MDKQVYEERFVSQLGQYLHSSEIHLSLKEKSPKLIRLSACQDKVQKNALDFIGLKKLLKNLLEHKRQPLFTRVDRPYQDCQDVALFKAENSKTALVVKDLMGGADAVDLSFKTSHFIFNVGKESFSVPTSELLIDAILKGKSEFTVSEGMTFNIHVFHEKIKFYNIKSLKKLKAENALLAIDILSEDEENASLYAGNAGVTEGYTIKEHTLRVLETMNAQYSCHVDAGFEKKISLHLGYNFKSFLRFTMALHDLGKSRAVEIGKKYLQHDYILPVLKRNTELAGYSVEAKKLAESLMDNDIIGDYLMKKITMTAAVELLQEKATLNNLELKDYFRIQMAYYTFDAGSYPYLGQKVFEEEKVPGCMIPSAPRFEDLKNRMQ